MANDPMYDKTALAERLGDDAADCLAALDASFPHLSRKIAELWGTPALDGYLRELMLPDRDGRAGFPPEAASAIMRLAALHGKLGLTRDPSWSIWQWAADSDFVRGGKH